jgi:hypothetical protein
LQYAPHPSSVGTSIVHAVAGTLDQFDQAFAVILRAGCDALVVAGASMHFFDRCGSLLLPRNTGCWHYTHIVKQSKTVG